MVKRGRPRYPDILTPREWEVLALLREELSNEQIARRLGITERTAKYHVSEILGKLGVSSRQEAAAWEPERRPWWMSAGVPLAFISRKLSFGWLSPATAGIVAVVVVVGVGLLVWGLLQTRGSTGSSGDAGAASPTNAPVSAEALSADGVPTTYLRTGGGLQPIDPASAQSLLEYDPITVQRGRGPAAISPDGRTAAIGIPSSNDIPPRVELVDLRSAEPSATLDLPGTVNEIRWSSDGTRLYLRVDENCRLSSESTARRCDSMILTVDVAAPAVVLRTPLPAGVLHHAFSLSRPSSFAPTPDGSAVYLFANSIENASRARILTLDLESGAVGQELELPDVLWAAHHVAQPGGRLVDYFPALVAAPVGRRAYIVHPDADRVTVVDLEALRVARSSDIRPRTSLFERFFSLLATTAHADGRSPYSERWASISPDGRYLYVGGGSAVPQGESRGVGVYPNQSAGLRVIDTVSLEIVAEIEPGGDCAYKDLVAHPSGRYLYATTYGTDPGQTGIPQCREDGLLVLDPGSLEVIASRDATGEHVLVAQAR